MAFTRDDAARVAFLFERYQHVAREQRQAQAGEKGKGVSPIKWFASGQTCSVGNEAVTFCNALTADRSGFSPTTADNVSMVQTSGLGVHV